MNEVISQYPLAFLGPMLAVWILREVWSFRKNEKMFDLVRKTYDMHNVKGPDGVPVWYVRQGLEQTLEKLTDSINLQTTAFQSLVTNIQQMQKELTAIKK
jgi:hypothetical protein